MMAYDAFIESFVLLFLIIDPFLGLSVFIQITQGMHHREKLRQASLATGVAFGLLLVFLFTGLPLLNILGIDFASFRVAGGILLFLLGAQSVFGLEFKKSNNDKKAASILIGTPILCGPGALTTIIFLSKKHGFVTPILASLLVMAITWLLLYFSEYIHKFLGDRLVQVVSRVLGLVLVSLAVQFVWDGIRAMMG